MNSDLLVAQFRREICDFINSYDIPFGMKYYILKDVIQEMGEVYDKVLQQATIIEQEQEKTAQIEIPINIEELSDKTKAKWEELQKMIKEEQEKKESESEEKESSSDSE